MAKKRDRIDIIEDMLSSMTDKGGRMKPTHLMYKSNLSHAQLQSYLEDLVNRSCVERVVAQKGNEYIIITDNGRQFLSKIREMRAFDKAFGI